MFWTWPAGVNQGLMGQHGQETACRSIPGEKWQIVQEKMVLQINFRIDHLRTHDDLSLGKIKPVPL